MRNEILRQEFWFFVSEKKMPLRESFDLLCRFSSRLPGHDNNLNQFLNHLTNHSISTKKNVL